MTVRKLINFFSPIGWYSWGTMECMAQPVCIVVLPFDRTQGGVPDEQQGLMLTGEGGMRSQASNPYRNQCSIWSSLS